MNHLVFGAAAGAFSGRAREERLTRIDGQSVDLTGHVPHQSVGSLRELLLRSSQLRSALKRTFTDPAQQDYLLRALPEELQKLGAVRNRAAHSETITIDALGPLRDAVVGVGTEGILARLARLGTAR